MVLVAVLVSVVIVINIPHLSHWILLSLIALGAGLTALAHLLVNRIARRRERTVCSYCLCDMDIQSKFFDLSSNKPLPVHVECRSLFKAARSA
jgi:predicted ATPase